MRSREYDTLEMNTEITTLVKRAKMTYAALNICVSAFIYSVSQKEVHSYMTNSGLDWRAPYCDMHK